MKKPRMVAPKQKPPTMPDADWAKELAWHAVVAVDRKKCRHIQRQDDVELAMATSFASYAASQGDSGDERASSATLPWADSKERHRCRQELFTKAAAVPHVTGIR
jgi:hypothetical protein